MRKRFVAAVAVALAAASMLCAYGQEAGKRSDTEIGEYKHFTQSSGMKQTSDLGKCISALTNATNRLNDLRHWMFDAYTATTNYAGRAKSTLDDVRSVFKQGNETHASATNTVALVGQCLNNIQDIKTMLSDSRNPTLSPDDAKRDSGPAKVGKGFGILAAWIAAGAAILAAILAMTAVVVAKGGINSVKMKMDAEAKQRKDDLSGLRQGLTDLVRNAFDDADLKSVKTQMASAKMSATTIEDKVLALDRDLREQPAKLDAVAKAFSRDAENQRRAITDALFGRGKGPAEAGGLVPQFEARIAALEKELLAAVTTERELQARKSALDARENKLLERERDISAELAAAREKGAAEAMGKVTALEAADASLRKAFDEMQARLSEKISAQSQEFGKRLAALESERNGAVAASRKAETEAVEVGRRAAMAEQNAGKLKIERDAAVAARAADVARLNDEIRRRDEARDAEIAKARENIRAEIENETADVMEKLKADAKSARDNQAKIEESARQAATESAKTIESLRAVGAETEAALVTAQSSLEAEKSARASEHAEAERILAAEKAAAAKALADEKLAHEADCQKAKAEVAELAAARDAARTRLFPAELASDSGFGPLIGSLDDLDARKLPGASLARAALTIFAERKRLPDKIWLRALGDFSLGLATAIDADGGDTVATLAKWKSMLEKIGAAAPSFSLRLPAIGSKVDIAWMHSRAGVSTVRKVRSWAVFGSAGNAYMAEVE